jgi:hypothetical protein
MTSAGARQLALELSGLASRQERKLVGSVLAPRRAARTRDGYRVQDTPAGAPVGAPIRTAGDASF